MKQRVSYSICLYLFLVIQNVLILGHELWATRSAARLFAHPAHSFASSAQLASLTCHDVLARSLSRSYTRFRTHETVEYFCPEVPFIARSSVHLKPFFLNIAIINFVPLSLFAAVPLMIQLQKIKSTLITQKITSTETRAMISWKQVLLFF